MSKKTPTYTDPWYSKPGFVYFIGAGDPIKAIKIGVAIATGFTQRLRSHQSSNHEPLTVLGIIDYRSPDLCMRRADKRERELHILFSAHQRFQHTWAGHEWFNPHQEILDYIKLHTVPCSTFDLVDSVAKLGPGYTKSA